MKMKKLINLFMKPGAASLAIKETLERDLQPEGFEISRVVRKDASFNAVIGGDGTFLKAVHESHFSEIPFWGINTGTLGFFQESDAASLGRNLQKLVHGQYFKDELLLLHAEIVTGSWTYQRWCVNEFAVKSKVHKTVHAKLSVDDIPLLHLAGDGLIFSTPSGSTAYNLSAGGAILYQTLDGYQITPLDQLQSKSYDALPASIVLPSSSESVVSFTPEEAKRIVLMFDGREELFTDLRFIRFTMPGKTIKRILFSQHWYWYNLKDKLIGSSDAKTSHS